MLESKLAQTTNIQQPRTLLINMMDTQRLPDLQRNSIAQNERPKPASRIITPLGKRAG